MMLVSLLLTLILAVHGQQTCENYGTANGSSCSCPTGFGGETCSQLGCGGTIFDSSRTLTPGNSTAFANFTSAGCTCENDWSGLGCNVCTTPAACQTGYTRAGHSLSDGVSSTPDVQNNTLTCNSSPRVWAVGQMSCRVNNPTIQAIFPGASNINIIRALNPSLSPVPNSDNNNNTMFVQLFYNAVEQFYCASDTCVQTTTDATSSKWTCQNLKCVCRPGTTFCAPGGLADLTDTIDKLSGEVSVNCTGTSCKFQQAVLSGVFGSSGLGLESCGFGECVRQSVIDNASGNFNSGGEASGGKQFSGGVIAGLAVVCALVLLALVLLAFGLLRQRAARRTAVPEDKGRYNVEWNDISYTIPSRQKGTDDKMILDSISGTLPCGNMMAILGPSGAGKTTFVEILARKHKSGRVAGTVSFPSSSSSSRQPRIGFVPQQDILPPTLTVFEALLFAARLRLPEHMVESEKKERVEVIVEKLGLNGIAHSRIGGGIGAKGGRGISGGEMRRVSIGLELVAEPDVLILDEPTSGLDSVSAAKVAQVLHAIAHDSVNPRPVIASIHQPSSQLYQTFDAVLLLSHGHAIYSGAGLFAPVDHFSSSPNVPPCPPGYNVADYLLEIASDPPVELFRRSDVSKEKPEVASDIGSAPSSRTGRGSAVPRRRGNGYAATFLTQLQVLSGREWKILTRDWTLFFTHLAVSAILGVFCGGLYYKTGDTIAGFQSRIGCLFFLGALIAFSSLSALHNLVEARPLFLRERSSGYYSPTAWLLSRVFFDMIPLRIIPSIIVATVTYWMAGLTPDAAHYFKFLLIIVLYAISMTLFNFLLGATFTNGGIAILLSALTALYQMTFAGFFVHLNAIPPVLRWLQWICPLKYMLEALSVNEVIGSGLAIKDQLQGVPVDVSASLILQLLFGFEPNSYYRDVLVLFGFIAGFALGVIGVVWLRVRERR